MFEALGDPVRRAILQMVADGEQPAGTLVSGIREHAPISQPAVSQHLKVLREAGLVQVRSEGNRRIYALEPAGIAVAREWLTGLVDPLAQFTQPLDALATEVARGTRARREKTADPRPTGREIRPA
ncbi:ArsR/SmtB family transcription factor [Nocardia sp. NBC_00416]|uniref:ArsR/SmtB family transcription factor n=1 Tax=Nocardia sp. NBC_00416 TaxID=2975991 RepID=UPI002E1CB1E7